MALYIDGIELPKDKTVAVIIHPNGTAYTTEIVAGVCTKHLADCTASDVPLHGKLIDADAVTAAAMEDILGWEDAGCDRSDYRAFLDNYIKDAPAIIPASGSGRAKKSSRT